MTNKEFQIQLEEMYKKFPLIVKREQKTLNELVYVLRMSGEDYQLNTFDKSEPYTWGCIPGVQETFIPVRDLSKNVVSVEFDEETYEDMGIKLLMVNLESDNELTIIRENDNGVVFKSNKLPSIFNVYILKKRHFKNGTCRWQIGIENANNEARYFIIDSIIGSKEDAMNMLQNLLR